MRPDKTILAKKAEEHTSYMQNIYANEIDSSVARTVEYTGSCVYQYAKNKRYENTTVELQNVTTEVAVANNNLEGKTAVLNFASYKNPGGGFINGMMTQEEALCHVSNLYNILKHFKNTYYKYNRDHLNRALYLDRALYIPDVQFTSGKQVDVITCAAPNLSPIMRYNSVDSETVMKTIISRVAFLFSIIEKQQVDTVILGAWGCGVFMNDPYIMSYLLTHFLQELNGCVKKAIFAVPDAKHKTNYKAFDKMINNPADGANDEFVKHLLPYLAEYEKYLK